jgi:hypothetical protein
MTASRRIDNHRLEAPVSQAADGPIFCHGRGKVPVRAVEVDSQSVWAGSTRAVASPKPTR